MLNKTKPREWSKPWVLLVQRLVSWWPYRPVQVSPAEEYLLCCIQSLWQADALPEPPTDLEPDDLWAAAKRHSMGPLLGWLQLRARVLLPNSLAAKALQQYYSSVWLAAQRDRLAQNVLQAFYQAGLQPVVLKGLHYAHWLYPSPGLRPSADIDLWLPPAHIAQAHALLQALGGRCHHRLAMNPANNQVDAFFFEGYPTQIDLHYALLPPTLGLGLDETAMLQRTHYQSIHSLSVRVLAPSDALAYACVHVYKNSLENLGSLLWYADIGLIVSKNHVVTCFGIRRTDRAIGLVLSFAQALYQSGHDAARVHPQLYRRSLQGRDAWLPGTDFGFRFWRAEGWLAKWQNLRSMLFPARSYMLARFGRHPKFGLAYAYVLRWRQVVWRVLLLAFGQRR